jgi:hypothetical protein
VHEGTTCDPRTIVSGRSRLRTGSHDHSTFRRLAIAGALPHTVGVPRHPEDDPPVPRRSSQPAAPTKPIWPPSLPSGGRGFTAPGQ